MGQFWNNSKPISKPCLFANRDVAEDYVARTFKRDINEIRKCWIGYGRVATLYVTRLEDNDGQDNRETS